MINLWNPGSPGGEIFPLLFKACHVNHLGAYTVQTSCLVTEKTNVERVVKTLVTTRDLHERSFEINVVYTFSIPGII